MTESSADRTAEFTDAAVEVSADDLGYVVLHNERGEMQSAKGATKPEFEVSFKWGKTRLTAELAQRASTRARIITATSGK